jgi:hypothetical protein
MSIYEICLWEMKRDGFGARGPGKRKQKEQKKNMRNTKNEEESGE